MIVINQLRKPLVLCDYHHGALYYSFHLLIEKRLGGTLIRPTGYGWRKKHFWVYSNNLGVIRQYLEPPPKEFLKDGIYHIPSLEGTIPYVQKAITFDKFLELPFDFIIASVHGHESVYDRLIRQHKPNAVLIRQLGNSYETCDFSICRNVLEGCTIPMPADVNMVRYHPEFSLEDYRYISPETHNTIRNIMNCLPDSKDAPLWYEYKKALSDYIWKMHGILGEDGLLAEQHKSKTFKNSAFIWHIKAQGDGYGFVIHNAYACGRPCIVKTSYYRKCGGLADALLEDSVTCIDLESGTKEENIKKIRYFSKPGNHLEMCENAHKRFKQVVDFDKEFKHIQEFLERAKT